MKIFTINDQYKIVCDWKKTRNGFKHEATLFQGEREVAFAKICYLNRTRESFEYESVIEKVLDTYGQLSNEDIKEIMKYLRWESEKERSGAMNMVAGIAKLGEIFGWSQKESNDRKARMLKAWMPGLSIPEDWDTLSEEEKETRLNKVIAECQA